MSEKININNKDDKNLILFIQRILDYNEDVLTGPEDANFTKNIHLTGKCKGFPLNEEWIITLPMFNKIDNFLLKNKKITLNLLLDLILMKFPEKKLTKEKIFNAVCRLKEKYPENCNGYIILDAICNAN